MKRDPLTKEGAERLRKELERLKKVDRPEIIAAIAEARAHGDLKENAEYHAAREALAHLERQVGEKRSRLASCEIVEKSAMPKGEVAYGSRVTVKDLSDGMDEVYELVGPGEEDYDGDVLKILTSSPLAQSMLGKKVGDQFEAEIPAGTLKMEVVSIEDA